MSLTTFRRVAWQVVEKIGDRLSGAISSLPASGLAIYEMCRAYDALQEPLFRDIEQVIAFNKQSTLMPFDEAEFRSSLAVRPFMAAELMHICSGGACMVARIAIREVERYANADNPKIYFIRGRDGQRVSLADIKQMEKDREEAGRFAYVQDMIFAIAGLTDSQRGQIHSKRTNAEFELGETTYAYGIRMLTNTIYPYMTDHSTGMVRVPEIIAKCGLKDVYGSARIAEIFSDVFADINHRYENKGEILPPRGGKIGGLSRDGNKGPMQ